MTAPPFSFDRPSFLRWPIFSPLKIWGELFPFCQIGPPFSVPVCAYTGRGAELDSARLEIETELRAGLQQLAQLKWSVVTRVSMLCVTVWDSHTQIRSETIKRHFSLDIFQLYLHTILRLSPILRSSRARMSV